jgi:hypothetical protein
VLTAACLDFVEPDLPERGAPAVARISVVLSDSGSIDVEGEIAPGIDDSGVRRTLVQEDVRAAGLSFAPGDTTPGGGRLYASRRQIGPDQVAGAIEVFTPAITHTTAAPAIRWAVLRRFDADTVTTEEDGSLRLRATELADPTLGAPPDTRQWFLTLIGDDNNFRLGADGPPPDTFVVPARWIPTADETIVVRLIYQQSARLDADSLYIGLITVDQRVHWIVRTRSGDGP